MGDRFLNRLSRVSLHFADQSQASFALCEGHNRLAPTLPQDGVYFPVTKRFSLIDGLRALFNVTAMGQFAMPIIATVAFTTFLLASQMAVQITTRLLISQNVLVDPLRTDADPFFADQPAQNLFRAPGAAWLRSPPRFLAECGIWLCFTCSVHTDVLAWVDTHASHDCAAVLD